MINLFNRKIDMLMATINDKHSTIYGLYLQMEVYNVIYVINWEMKIYYKFEWTGGLWVKV